MSYHLTAANWGIGTWNTCGTMSRLVIIFGTAPRFIPAIPTALRSDWGRRPASAGLSCINGTHGHGRTGIAAASRSLAYGDRRLMSRVMQNYRYLLPKVRYWAIGLTWR